MQYFYCKKNIFNNATFFNKMETFIFVKYKTEPKPAKKHKFFQKLSTSS
jgi:hypothetical protein